MNKRQRMIVSNALLNIANGGGVNYAAWNLARLASTSGEIYFSESRALIYGKGITHYPAVNDHERRTYAGLIAAAIKAGDLP